MNICVIGLGSMGKRRIKLLKNRNEKLSIIGIDNNLERTKRVSDEYGIICYPSLSDVNSDLDCAFICTSPQFHAELIKECLHRDLHVFSEINLISDLYNENIQEAKKRDKVLFLSSTPLYKSEIQIIDQKIKENGETCAYLYHVGQYLPDWHPWDNLKDFFVSNKSTNGCREILAIELPWIQKTFGKIKNINVTKRKLTKLNVEFPDTYLIQLDHVNGNMGTLLIDVVSRQAVRRLEIINENLYIKWDGTPDSLYEKDILSGELKAISSGAYIHEKGYRDFINEFAYSKEIDEFFSVLKGKTAMYGFEEDIDTLKIIDQIEG